MAVGGVCIRVSLDTWRVLVALKSHPRDTHDDVIRSLLPGKGGG